MQGTEVAGRLCAATGELFCHSFWLSVIQDQWRSFLLIL